MCDSYIAIYIWKIVEEIVPNLSPPICVNASERRGHKTTNYHYYNY